MYGQSTGCTSWSRHSLADALHPIGDSNAKARLDPYAVRDYYGINPDYGTAADLHQLVSEAHKHGMRVIIDIVANHTAWDSVLMRNPAYYTHDAGGHIVSPQPDWAMSPI